VVHTGGDDRAPSSLLIDVVSMAGAETLARCGGVVVLHDACMAVPHGRWSTEEHSVVLGDCAPGFSAFVRGVDGFDALSGALSDARQGHGGAELVRASGVVEALRETKDAGEIALLRAACAAADAALADLVGNGGLRPGRTERAVARELESLMVDHGADGRAFETIVAAGANSAVPHHRPTEAVLGRGDFVKIDFGALLGGYHSDMTRTFVLGQATDWQREIYGVVLTAQQAGREALEVGAGLCDVDDAARQVIVDAGYGEHFGHGLGHGVGLQIHEAPGINSAAAGTLRAGSVVTVEPPAENMAHDERA
jgi:Xaa-Pro aminopeptidase